MADDALREAKATLKAVGLWDDFCDQGKALVAEGRSKEDAYAELLPVFLARAADLPKRKRPDMFADALWVYENMGAKSADAWTSPPPGPGAVRYLEWAQKHAPNFYAYTVPKLFPAAADRKEAEKRADDDAGPAERTTDRLLAHARNALQAHRPDESGWESHLPQGTA